MIVSDAVASVLENQRRDTMDVYRFTTTRRENGSDKQELEQVYTGVRCHLSRKQRTTAPEGAVPAYWMDFMVYCSPNTDIRTGDILDITMAAGGKFRLKAGRPFPYPTHWEVSISGEAKADGRQ